MTHYTTTLTREFLPIQLARKQVEVLNVVLHTQHELGLLPVDDNEQTPRGTFDQKRFNDILKDFNHETAALVTTWRETLPNRWQPYGYLGLTSSNLIDCATAMAAREVTNNFIQYVDKVLKPLVHENYNKLQGKLREGRTHGQVAAPVRRNKVYVDFLVRLSSAVTALKESLPPGALAGPVGEPDIRVITPEVQQTVSNRLGIELDRTATQIANRQQWLTWLFHLYQIIGCCEQLATHHRLESLTNIDRFQEKFNRGTQRGSSSMPHKVNPIRSERICGLSRVARGHFLALMETASSGWWERDLSNSSVEKTAMFQLISLAGFVLKETGDILLGANHLPGAAKLDPRASSHYRLVESQLRGLNPDEGMYYKIQQEGNDAGDYGF